CRDPLGVLGVWRDAVCAQAIDKGAEIERVAAGGLEARVAKTRLGRAGEEFAAELLAPPLAQLGRSQQLCSGVVPEQLEQALAAASLCRSQRQQQRAGQPLEPGGEEA